MGVRVKGFIWFRRSWVTAVQMLLLSLVIRSSRHSPHRSSHSFTYRLHARNPRHGNQDPTDQKRPPLHRQNNNRFLLTNACATGDHTPFRARAGVSCAPLALRAARGAVRPGAAAACKMSFRVVVLANSSKIFAAFPAAVPMSSGTQLFKPRCRSRRDWEGGEEGSGGQHPLRNLNVSRHHPCARRGLRVSDPF